jgi:hypothetical protein
MQDYTEQAAKNGVVLQNKGACQFCGATAQRGVHECVEIFSLGFPQIDYANPDNHIYRFLAVDAHTLQHPEIHGRWNNHFHLSRQHLIFHYKVKWNYQLSPKLSDSLNAYKATRQNEYLKPPPILQRGLLTTTAIKNQAQTEAECQSLVEQWGKQVYEAWGKHHSVVDSVAREFLNNTLS